MADSVAFEIVASCNALIQCRQDTRFATLLVVVIEAELLVEVAVLWVGYGEDQGPECCVAKVEMSESQYCRCVGMKLVMGVYSKALAQ